ncbi:BgTH12-02675 [Blumeria graminis f. sp. triticale]|uniref:Mitochondrial inner membrane carnitine transporter n=4 Tax=Blumeria graminis TaxID=34373 RepID=A0A656KKM4_BLUGR|nr:Mitochondrial inner membrane carnitine transporter [Blumeria graminis f. sp. tritici 96224]CAD6503002.1 BgTH12-02675 [Blumeria graminis f. sp. triticale]VDB88929.1 Bgt-1108 [Blumeria graminis f. sp. tritici]
MSADFWAGYISGIVGILVGNPLDIIKVRLQCSPSSRICTSHASPTRQVMLSHSLILGAAAPTIGYGALNALLFTTYNRTLTLLNSDGHHESISPWMVFSAGAIGGLATWVISTPTELVKCRVQASPATGGLSSLVVAKSVFRSEGLRSLYLGGKVTALRDSIGYGVYFSTYEFATRYASSFSYQKDLFEEVTKVLLCGGLAGTLSWACVFPLDVIKTRLQTQPPKWIPKSRSTGMMLAQRAGAVKLARMAYRQEGLSIFFRGLTVCSLRAFLVNAIQWIVYERVMRGLVRAHDNPALGREE